MGVSPVIKQVLRLIYATKPSLSEPVVSTLDLSGRIQGNAKGRFSAGFRAFGGCIRYAAGIGAADIDADFKLWLSLVINLNPEYHDRVLTIRPTARLVGDLRDFKLNVSNGVALIANPITPGLGLPSIIPIAGPSYSILDKIIDKLAANKLDANGEYKKWLDEQNVAINNLMDSSDFRVRSWRLPGRSPNELSDVGLAYLAESALTYPLPLQYFEANNDKLMYSLLTNDRKSAGEVLANSAACEASNALRTNMPKQPLYQKSGTVCQLASVNEASTGSYYSDSSCLNANIQLRSYADICGEHLKPGLMGDPNQWGGGAAGAQSGWTYSYASQFKIGYDNLANYSVPFFKRVNYKKISPVYDRNVTTVYNEEGFQSALKQCMARLQFNGNPQEYCQKTVLPSQFYQTMPRSDSTIFNRYKYNSDLDVCQTQLAADYLTNSSKYNFKYGLPNFTSRTLSSSQLSAIRADCDIQLSTATNFSDKYALVIDGDGSTKVDKGLRAGYYSACYGGNNNSFHYSVNGQSMSIGCLPLRLANDPVFLTEIEQPIQRGNGSCSLEMRVYKKDPNATNLKPLIMFHGGSWNRRAFGFVGIESLIADYTERGYIVFAPFYRLAGELDANQECNGSYSRDMAQDAMDAFNWVKANGYQQGAQLNARPRLFGQSAGAYFVGYIVGKTTTADVEKAVMMYPPTDPISYAEGYKARWIAGNGVVSRSLGDDALEAFLDAKLDWYVSTDANLKNKFVASTAGMSVIDLLKTGSHAPVYMVHGNHDLLVPVQQSVSLCNALGGSASATASTYSCGSSGSMLTVVDKAAHMLDLCIDGLVCPAEDKAAAAQALQSVKNWFIQ